MTIRAVIKGCGAYLPEKILTNDDLAKMVDTSDEWIVSRTGIKQRHIIADDEAVSDLATRAALAALDDAKMQADDIDQIIVATTTPDLTFPATASIVQQKLGIRHGAGFDVQAVCSGFVFGMGVADSMIQTGLSQTTLLIGAEAMTKILDWEDRDSCVLFGDGAGAVILQAAQGAGDMNDKGVLATYLRTDGEYVEHLYVDGGVSSNQQTGFIRMNGRDVFRHAVSNITDAIVQTLKKADMTAAQVDWFIPHQANQRIIAAVGQKIGLDEEKVILTVSDHANTSAASIPLALQAARADGRIKSGDLVMFEAMGGGFSWGASLVRI